MADPEDRSLQARAAVLRAAVPRGVRVSFADSRRRTDLTLALLRGERLSVLSLAPRLSDEVPADVEIVRSARVGRSFELMVALTEKLEQQPLRSPERRAKLRRLAHDARGDDETAELLENGEAV